MDLALIVDDRPLTPLVAPIRRQPVSCESLAQVMADPACSAHLKR
jgi:hypothetical protein